MNNLFNSIYKNKRVLVTGHTGFKGSWLCLWLKELGANIIGYSLDINTNPNLFELLELNSGLISIIDDIRNENGIFEAINTYKPEIVFHLAAQPLVRLSYEDPKFTYETNILGTINLFESIRKSSSVKVVVNVTTDKCYDNKEWNYSYREIDPMGGYDPYSSSKACVELITNSYRNSYFKDRNIALASVRAGNVIGGGDWSSDRLIPDMVKSFFRNERVIIRNPSAIRPWQYVLEPLSGYLWLGSLMYNESHKYSEGWNFGPNDNNLTVKDIIEKSISILGYGDYVVEKSKEFYESNLLNLDITKAKSKINWHPVYNNEEALVETINWYKYFYNYRGLDIREYSINQIKEYTKKAIEKNILWSLVNE